MVQSNILSKSYRILSKVRHSKYSSPAKNLSKCILIVDEFPVSNIRHIALIICQTGRAFQYFVTKDTASRCAAVKFFLASCLFVRYTQKTTSKHNILRLQSCSSLLCTRESTNAKWMRLRITRLPPTCPMWTLQRVLRVLPSPTCQTHGPRG